MPKLVLDSVRIFAVATVMVWAVAAMPAAGAEDCPRGTLDKQYCDRDGDLVADLLGNREAA